MSHHQPPHLKRLQHDPHSTSHSHSHQSSNNRSHLPNDEAMRESLLQLTVSASDQTKHARPFRPEPHRARRGGARGHTRYWPSSLPRRAINYDLAESFVDHSTNPLSSDLYKVKFKHSTKQWPNGRFVTYTEKLDKLDDNIVEITCTRTFPVVPKRKRVLEINESEHVNQRNLLISTSLLTTAVDPNAQEEKKKQVDKQSTVYANLFGGGRIPRLSAATQAKKPSSTTNPTPSSASISLLDENSGDHHR